MQGLCPGLRQVLHSSPMLQHCVEQVLHPGAPERLCLPTQSCLLWGRAVWAQPALPSCWVQSSGCPQGSLSLRPEWLRADLRLADPPSKLEPSDHMIWGQMD